MSLPNYRGRSPLPYMPDSQVNYPIEYFSGCDVSIFMQDLCIDEVTDLQFSMHETVQPVFSYASYTAKKILHGARIVQGSFTINMRAGDYLHELLYKDVTAAITQSGYPLGTATSQPDPNKDPQGFIDWVDAQRSQYWDAIQSTIDSNQTTDLSTMPYFINSGFDIMIVYGDIDTVDIERNKGRIRMIENVHIWSAGQVMSLDMGPQNIREKFNFAAVDLNGANRLGKFL